MHTQDFAGDSQGFVTLAKYYGKVLQSLAFSAPPYRRAKLCLPDPSASLEAADTRCAELIACRDFEEGRRITIAEGAGVDREALSKMIKRRGFTTSTDHIDGLCRYYDCQTSGLTNSQMASGFAGRPD